MLTNNTYYPHLTLKLFMLCLIIIATQLIINSISPIYVDILGMFLVILLMNQISSYQQLFILTFIADIIGHWYLGTHLFSLILISFITEKYYNFYKMSNILQKNISIMLFFSLFNGIICLIGLLSHNLKIDILGFAFEIILFCPLLFFIVNKVFKNTNADFIY